MPFLTATHAWTGRFPGAGLVDELRRWSERVINFSCCGNKELGTSRRQAAKDDAMKQGV